MRAAKFRVLPPDPNALPPKIRTYLRERATGTQQSVVFTPLARGIAASGVWCTSTVGFAPFARGIAASGVCCTSTVGHAPVARGIGASGA
jgi:hypothetical protein